MIYDVTAILSWVNIIATFFILAAIFSFLNAISGGGLGNLLGKIPGLGGLGGGGGGGGGSTDLTPILDRLDRVEQNMGQRFNNVDNSLVNLTATVGQIKTLVEQISAAIQQVITHLNDWTAIFNEFKAKLDAIKAKLDSGVDLSPEERARIEEMFKKYLIAFKASLEDVEKRLTEKLENLSKKTEELGKQIEIIKVEIENGFKLVQNLEKELAELSKKIQNLPKEVSEQIKLVLEAEIRKIILELDAVKKQIEQLSVQVSTEHNTIIEKIKAIGKTGTARINYKKIQAMINELLKNLEDQLKAVNGGITVNFGKIVQGNNTCVNDLNMVNVDLKQLKEVFGAFNFEADAGRTTMLRDGNIKLMAQTQALTKRIKRVQDQAEKTGEAAKKTREGEKGDLEKIEEQIIGRRGEKVYVETEFAYAKKLPALAKEIEKENKQLDLLNKTPKAKDANKAALKQLISQKTDEFKKSLRQESRGGLREYFRANPDHILRYISSLNDTKLSGNVQHILTNMKIFEQNSIKYSQQIIPSLIAANRWADIKKASDSLVKTIQGWTSEINQLEAIIKKLKKSVT